MKPSLPIHCSVSFILAVLLGNNLCGQTIDYPYNPDSNGDGAVGAVDLLELLPIFGSYFSPNEIQVNGISLEDYLTSIEASIDSLSFSGNNGGIDTIYIENEQLYISLSGGTTQSFNLPQSVQEITTNNYYNSYNGSTVPLWMINAKNNGSSSILSAALATGLIADEEDFRTFIEAAPEAIWSQIPFNCDTQEPTYDFIPASYGYCSSCGTDCSPQSGLILNGLNLSFGSVQDFNCLNSVDIFNSSCIGTRWVIPFMIESDSHGNSCSHYPLYCADSDFSYSEWSTDGWADHSKSVGSFYSCNFSNSSWTNITIGDTFFDCDLSESVFYDVNMWFWPFEYNTIMTNVEFRCMEEGEIQYLPGDWQYESDPNCVASNRYRFFQD